MTNTATLKTSNNTNKCGREKERGGDTRKRDRRQRERRRESFKRDRELELELENFILQGLQFRFSQKPV